MKGVKVCMAFISCRDPNECLKDEIIFAKVFVREEVFPSRSWHTTGRFLPQLKMMLIRDDSKHGLSCHSTGLW